MHVWKEIRDREGGKVHSHCFAKRIKSNRISQLELSNQKDIVSPHKGAINSLQIDSTEGRYLLSAASDASVAVFDLQRPAVYQPISKHSSLFLLDKHHRHAHKFSVSSAIWYPIDTGLFVTASYDHHINVWDTNTIQVVVNFKMPGKVHRAAMSNLSTSHMLIAAATEDVQVRLCDIASGAFAHTLLDGVMTVEWSNSSEWVLVTGGCDGAIRFWDIRRAGCFLVLDQSRTQLGRRPPVLKGSMMTKSKALSLQDSSTKSRAAQKKHANGSGSKQLPIGRVPSKGPMKQRLHPGMLSTQDRATAHYGAVTGLKVTEDGMYLLSAGSDSRLRLWDVQSGCDTLVNFETVRLQINKPLQFATTQDATLVFVPCMRSVKAFDMWSGNMKSILRGHYECVNSCWFNQQDQELYTGGNDRQILVWAPARSIADEMDGPAEDQDNWSS
ncbi:hypothetical protein Fmac_000478 [Flemingia macrophylla]|uniref:DNA excision repair protein ERCC-8 n=1 Tax=Flemingia macrophylla TaxID=520843 RepID=A0ABD1NF16_9FABA